MLNEIPRLEVVRGEASHGKASRSKNSLTFTGFWKASRIFSTFIIMGILAFFSTTM